LDIVDLQRRLLGAIRVAPSNNTLVGVADSSAAPPTGGSVILLSQRHLLTELRLRKPARREMYGSPSQRLWLYCCGWTGFAQIAEAGGNLSPLPSATAALAEAFVDVWASSAVRDHRSRFRVTAL
jgi:hypothetical protein